MSRKIKIRLITGLWGASFSEMFSQIACPSLLADGNLRYICEKYDVKFSLYVPQAELDYIEASPAFKRIRNIVDVETHVFSLSEIQPDEYESHDTLWRRAVHPASRRDEFIIFIIPDNVYGEGTLKLWCDALADGASAVYSPGPQVCKETIESALLENFLDNATGVLSMPKDAVPKLLVEHIHPLVLTMFSDSPSRNLHPEHDIKWIRDEGLIMRCYTSNPVAIDTRVISKTIEHFKPIEGLDRVRFVPCTVLSIEPIMKHAERYYLTDPFDGLMRNCMGSWSDHYHSGAAISESAQVYEFPLMPAGFSKDAKRRAIAGGEVRRTQFILSAILYRLLVLTIPETTVLQLFATALQTIPLRRHLLTRKSWAVLLPSQDCLWKLYDGEGDPIALLAQGRESELLEMFNNFILIRDEAENTSDLLTLNGARIKQSPLVQHAVIEGPIFQDGLRIYKVSDRYADMLLEAKAKNIAVDQQRLGISGESLQGEGSIGDVERQAEPIAHRQDDIRTNASCVPLPIRGAKLIWLKQLLSFVFEIIIGSERQARLQEKITAQGWRQGVITFFREAKILRRLLSIPRKFSAVVLGRVLVWLVHIKYGRSEGLWAKALVQSHGVRSLIAEAVQPGRPLYRLRLKAVSIFSATLSFFVGFLFGRTKKLDFQHRVASAGLAKAIARGLIASGIVHADEPSSLRDMLHPRFFFTLIYRITARCAVSSYRRAYQIFVTAPHREKMSDAKVSELVEQVRYRRGMRICRALIESVRGDASGGLALASLSVINGALARCPDNQADEIAALERAAGVRPEMPSIWLELIMAHLDRGDQAQAKNVFLRAKEVDKAGISPENLRELALLYEVAALKIDGQGKGEVGLHNFNEATQYFDGMRNRVGLTYAHELLKVDRLIDAIPRFAKYTGTDVSRWIMPKTPRDLGKFTYLRLDA
jgi:hypothetical protein